MVVHKLRSEHTRMFIRITSWILDEAETKESAAEVCHLNSTTTWLCYEHFKYRLREVVATSRELVAECGI